jgi:hypothetical protein
VAEEVAYEGICCLSGTKTSAIGPSLKELGISDGAGVSVGVSSGVGSGVGSAGGTAATVFIAGALCFFAFPGAASLVEGVTGCEADLELRAVATLLLELLRVATLFGGGGWGSVGWSSLSPRFFVLERVLLDLNRSLNYRYSSQLLVGSLR